MKPEKSSNITQHSSRNTEITKPSNAKIKNNHNSDESISVTIGGSKLPFSLSQLTVIGILTVAVIATFFIVNKGSDFCFLSTCYELPNQNPIASNFVPFVGGLGMYGALTLMGVSLPIAALGALGVWLFMQLN
jgi:hypothetical protein